MGKSIDIEAELHDSDDFTGFTVTVTYDYRYEYKLERLQATATRFYRQSERVTRHWVEHGCPGIEVFDFSSGGHRGHRRYTHLHRHILLSVRVGSSYTQRPAVITCGPLILHKGSNMVHELICECKLEWNSDPAEADQVKGPEDAADVVTDFIKDKPQEHLVVLLLSNQNAVVGINVVAIGTGNACRAQVADVLRPAILANANGIILAHNHPSGSINPSPEDIALTEKIKAGADLMGINLLDHVIVGSYGKHLSIREQCGSIF